MIDASQLPVSMSPPANSQNQSTRTKSLGQSDFMNLLVKQLQFQDPMNPMSNADFTAQMAQFSSLDQLTSINKQLQTMTSSQNLAAGIQGVNFLGKQVKAAGDALTLTGGTTGPISYQLAQDSSAVILSIYDSSGQVIRQVQSAAQAKGDHSYQWDGRSGQGTSLPDGIYRVQIQALNKLGQPVQVNQWLLGKVDGVSFQNGAPILHVAGNQIPLSNVLEVLEPVKPAL
ncbi:MAG TPA: FlgD immunoglobulin-like domain containing protein [bacterium]|nr:FlgD immunoglobulin-like domain containing protein [bacterium]